MTSNAQTWDNYYTLADTVEVGDIIDLDGVSLKVIEKKKTTELINKKKGL